jgi:large subunit ribosomal protein LP0
LSKLGIKPFSYGLQTIKVFDEGAVYDPNILELTDDDFDDFISHVVKNITALCIELSIPNLAAVLLLLNNGLRNVHAIAFSIG